MAAPSPLSYPFKTEHHHLLYARQSEAKAADPKSRLGLQVQQAFCNCSRAGDGILTVDNASHVGSVCLWQQADRPSLLFPLSAEQTLRKMLAKAFVDADKCKFLARYACNFVRYAAIEAAKQRAAELELYLIVSIHTILECDEAGSIVGAAGGGVGEDCLPCSPPLEETDEEYFPRSCPVCLSDFSFSDGEEVAALPCSYVFHRECIKRWTERTRHCPMCRESVICV